MTSHGLMDLPAAPPRGGTPGLPPQRPATTAWCWRNDRELSAPRQCRLSRCLAPASDGERLCADLGRGKQVRTIGQRVVQTNFG